MTTVLIRVDQYLLAMEKFLQFSLLWNRKNTVIGQKCQLPSFKTGRARSSDHRANTHFLAWLLFARGCLHRLFEDKAT